MPEPQSEIQHFTKNWQQQLAEAFNNIKDLCRYLHLSPDDLPVSDIAAENFPLRVPLSFAACMEKGNPHDPLLRQVLPIKEELFAYPGFSNDPVGDLAAATQVGVLHKYHGRVLFINTGSCAINCRYCFRRNFPYADLQLSKQKEDAAIQAIQDDPSISEVILSGGDPLLLSDSRLTRLIRQLDGIKHLKRIRIHSRLPIVLPARITDEFINTLTQSPKQIIIIVHCNHANEISDRVIAACASLKNSGITLFNQSVLLRGVNDNAEVLGELSEQLFSHGITPYYLHLLDKATGTGHFEVSEAEALALMRQVQAALPGYLVPKLVKEQAGATSKQTIL
ncbi:EF-P beta-lysylation protein EpmB [Methylobacter sp.]|uniref:EF-P beta-lysylation protein EpmB n=1 Tax=Methylobacter sp. TaxID=2051955 RepID=UPI002489698F|nr:EF-P beta-lysylation protein EpmB [Methylobacter sp.]MDI1277868.1 EF-P beta-lysylation protein EpmB [Methylobacter sp.]MDI1358637.1 EF-P beta-lysylation protein EpmB [Methylobacter sp.]